MSKSFRNLFSLVTVTALFKELQILVGDSDGNLLCARCSVTPDINQSSYDRVGGRPMKARQLTIIKKEELVSLACHYMG